MDRNVKLGLAIVIISVLVIVMGFLANGWRASGIDSRALKDLFNWEKAPAKDSLAKAPGAKRPEKILKARGETRTPVSRRKKTSATEPPDYIRKFLHTDQAGGPEKTKAETIRHLYKHRLAEVRRQARAASPAENETFGMDEEEREIFYSELRQNPEIAARNYVRAAGVSGQEPAGGEGSAASTGSGRSAQRSQTLSPAGKPARVLPGAGTYTVVKGDYLIKISAKLYGTKRHWRKIYEANRDKFPRGTMQLRPGMKLVIPELTSAHAAKGSAPSRLQTALYRIKENDTLTKIAAEHYKDPNKWVLIYRANKDVISDPDILISGTTIRLP